MSLPEIVRDGDILFGAKRCLSNMQIATDSIFLIVRRMEEDEIAFHK